MEVDEGIVGQAVASGLHPSRSHFDRLPHAVRTNLNSLWYGTICLCLNSKLGSYVACVLREKGRQK
jgi:hypothetical protein